MPSLCQLCDIHFENSLELEVHELSLSHHIKLEAAAPTAHICPACNVTCLSLGEYSKHVDTLEHRRRRDRMRAIIDTMDAGTESDNDDRRPRQIHGYPIHASNYLEPTFPFVRNGANRRTYPAPYRGPRYHNPQVQHQEKSFQFSYGDRPTDARDDFYYYTQHGDLSDYIGSHVDYGLAWNNHQIPNIAFHSHHAAAQFHEVEFHHCYMGNSDSRDKNAAEGQRLRLSCEVQKMNGCTEKGIGRAGDEVPKSSANSSAQSDGTVERRSSRSKRSLFARLRAKKEKGSAAKSSTDSKSSEKKDRKPKKKKSMSQSPSTSLRCEPKSAASVVSGQPKRAAPLVSMKDKTKKWELVAVKGKASYLKNRSQRLLKDRMSKYRLVDSKGLVVEDMHEEEPSTSSKVPSQPSTSQNAPGVSHLTSHIWGTGPEARPQQKDPSGKTLNASLAPSMIAPSAPRTPCLRRTQLSQAQDTGWNDTSSGYATMNGDLPMSTPKNYGDAVRAYENYQGLLIPDTVEAVLDEVSRARGVSANAPGNNGKVSDAIIDTSICSSVNSSLVVDSHTLASRMELTALPNVTRFSDIGVKEEPGESPPPDALPSPPQFDQTVNQPQRDAGGRKIVGDKEREEFWALGVAEMKKGHQIIETRSKIEGLQKQLLEATTFLQQKAAINIKMAEIQVYKTKITLACTLIRSSEANMMLLDLPFAFPSQKEECEAYIREKTAMLNHLMTSITKAKQLHDTHLKKAIETINSRSEQKEREKLMLELHKHLELESNNLEITVIQWRSIIDFRKEELSQQSSLITEAASFQASGNRENSHSGTGSVNSHERNVQVRRPLLETPTFSGNFREFNTFWSAFESLIHNDADLSNQEKFLFLKQALKGKAAASISSIPVIGDKYYDAILKKQYDRWSSIADILINEIEHLPRAQGNSSSCRNTLSAISSRIVHLEQTGVLINADRVWRRLILSKFTENICSQVIKRENEAGVGFEVKAIIDAVDDIITLQETTELTTNTLFGTTQGMQYGSKRMSTGHHETKPFVSQRTKQRCLCGDTHPPQQCTRYATPEARRMEAKRQRVCWKCFGRNHGSKYCATMGPCPKCNEDHHSFLCTASRSVRETTDPSINRRDLPLRSAQREETRFAFPTQTNRPRHPPQRNNNQPRETSRVQSLHAAPLRIIDTAVERPIANQCVLQMASALIFNEAKMDYQPITILLDSGAQRSFIKTRTKNELGFPTTSSIPLTTTGMGELQETFISNEVKITLKAEHSSRTQNLSVFTKDKLTSGTKTAHLSRADRRFIRKKRIIIAQRSLRCSKVTPDILIGQDNINQVIEFSSPAVRLPSGLVLTPTIFGYTISGTSGTATPLSKEKNSLCSSLVVSAPVMVSNCKTLLKDIIGLKSIGTNARSNADKRVNEHFMETNFDQSETAVVHKEKFTDSRHPKTRRASTKSESQAMPLFKPADTEAKFHGRKCNVSSERMIFRNRLSMPSPVLQHRNCHGPSRAAHSGEMSITTNASAAYRKQQLFDNSGDRTVTPRLRRHCNCLRKSYVNFSRNLDHRIVTGIGYQREPAPAVVNSDTMQETRAIVHSVAPRQKISVKRCADNERSIVKPGLLALHSPWKTSLTEQITKHINDANMLYFYNSKHLLDVAIEQWKWTIVARIAIAIFIAAVVLAVSSVFRKMIC